MGILRKLAIFVLVLVVVAGVGFYFLSQGDTADLSVEDVSGTEPILQEPQSESFPTVEIAKPVGWAENQLPEAADGLTVNRFAEGLDHPRVLYALPLSSNLSRKLTAKFCGPFRISEVLSDVTVKIELPQTWKISDTFHVSRLREVQSDGGQFPDRSRSPPPEPIIIDNEEEYEVEQILAHRSVKKGRRSIKEYLIKWKGYGPEENTWEPQNHLDGARELLQEYRSRVETAESAEN